MTETTSVGDEMQKQLREAFDLIDSNNQEKIYKGANILILLSEKDHKPAYPVLADLYLRGVGVEKDTAQAAILFEKSALSGNPESQNNMGWLYANGIGVKRNIQKSYEWYSKAARQGLAPAQYNLGECYQHGKGTQKDIIEATDLYLKSANQGYIESQYKLGKLYAKTQPHESFRWMRKTADNGHVMAQCETAKAYLSGNGAPQNPTLALNYLQLAVKQNHPESTFLLGKIFYEGYGTSRNQQKGISLIKKASNLGSQAATELLPKLSIKKFNLLASLQKASDGDINSIIDLGWNYLEGVNVGKNNIEAYAWFNLAAEFTGDKKHIWAKSLIAKQLDVNELIAAKKRASQISRLYSIKTHKQN